MKRIFIVTMLALALTGLALSQTPNKTAASSKAEQGVTKVLDEWQAASIRSDTAALERILADDFVITYTSGYTAAKADFIESFKSGARKIASLKGERQIRVHGDTALASGDMTDVGQLGGQDSQIYYRWTSVLMKRRDRWQVVAFHCTNIASPRKQIEQEIIKVTDEILDALAHTDVAKLDRLFTDNYAVTQSDGSQASKASLMEGFKSERLKYSAASARDLKVRSFGDTAVTTAILTLDGHNPGGDFTINAPITCAWVKQLGRWRLAAAHLSPNLAQ